jgi:murein DD-endopeptidase MepM/ murein hydrolase activator NlpD
MTALCFPLSSCLTPTGTQQPAEVVSYGVKGGAGSAGMHTVLNGDTVYTVSQRYNLPLREIISLNSLEAPYHLRSGFRLKLPPPNDYKVRPGDTLNGISRVFGVSVSETAKLNNLPPPYVIEKGQVLRLPTPQPAVVEQGFASAAPSPTFETAALRVPSVESEALAPPSGSVETASVSPAVMQSPPPVETSAAGFPPQPTAQPAPAAVQPAAATLPSNIAPKVPARTGRFMRPVDGNVISGYGPKDGGLHNDGINIRAAKGTAVRAAENGVVAYTGSEMAGYGNLVLIRHQDRWITAYAHMDKILVKKGDVVKAGQSIGTVGATGSVDSPQLHFEVRKGTKAENPAKYI